MSTLIGTTEKLASELNELLNCKWITERLCDKLSDKEFRYICVIKNNYGSETTIFNILGRANKR